MAESDKNWLLDLAELDNLPVSSKEMSGNIDDLKLEAEKKKKCGISLFLTPTETFA